MTIKTLPELWRVVSTHLAAATGAMLALGLVSLVVTALLLPTFIARLPADYFRSDKFVPKVPHTVPHVVLRLLKNGIGAFLVVAGVFMIVLPGQGLLTMALGAALLEFPGKRRLERAIATRPAVRAWLDQMRRRRGAPALEFD
jgi:hypothetical protein